MASRKNLLFLMTDHQRFDSIGMVQCGREVTPNLNSLAQESTFFTRAYNTCPLCVPARTALATGVYPTRNNVVFNDFKGVTSGSYKTIYQSLIESGRNTALIGVNHVRVNPTVKSLSFDTYYDTDDYAELLSQNNISVERKSEDIDTVMEFADGKYIDAKYSNTNQTAYQHDEKFFKDRVFTDKAHEFLNNSFESQKPFALFLYLWAPHPPLVVPKEYMNMYNPDEITLPPNVNIPSINEPQLRRKGVPAQLADNKDLNHWRKVWSAHLGLVSYADHLFGEILEKLKNSGRYENTTIVFTPDHGESLGQHKLVQKMEMYEQLIKVPLMIKDSSLKKGKVDTIVSHLDVAPTLFGLLDLPHLSQFDSKDITPLINSGELDKTRTAFCQYSGNPSYGTIRRTIITQKYKFTVDDANDFELYDLESDPLEQNNIANESENSNIVSMLLEKCKNYHIKHNDFFFE